METIVSDVAPIRVLIVEDEFLICEWVAEALGELGFAVHTVSNARDALRHLASAPVDVLFTDINLPGGMDGAALARRARDMMPELGVVYASARRMPGVSGFERLLNSARATPRTVPSGPGASGLSIGWWWYICR